MRKEWKQILLICLFFIIGCVLAVDSMVRCGVEGIVKMSQDGTYQTMLTK